MRRTASMFALLIGASTLCLAGCTQVAAVAPVGGDHLAEVRYAAIDVLLGAGTDILVAPVCDTDAGGAITCEGSTASDEPIAVVSPAEDQSSLTVKVGDDVVYSGSIMDVLDDAARTGS